jgi:hypothetical protein
MMYCEFETFDEPNIVLRRQEGRIVACFHSPDEAERIARELLNAAAAWRRTEGS